ncbi:hypothetical protein SE27_05055 [Acinetobacter harbinensis]|uniref:hypothetical protein n=1 Tax=Acinetobacter harbinensis TaxID=1353941 RepID=UPI00057EE1D4|nr:hypothetical protein [Acinetobacter harbinensis]KWQ04686.1 hypothetical protein SE27_05055 [Acinetobacter harbinensis]
MALTQANLIFNQELAAWVQAVGSVIAIFVAVAVPIYFDRKQRLYEQQSLQHQKQKFFIVLLPMLYQLRNTTATFLQEFQHQKDHEIDAITTLESEYLNLVPVFAKELHIFVHSNIYDEHLNQLAFELFHSEEILSQHLSQPSEKKWITHQLNLIQHAQKIDQLTSQTIQKIEVNYT